MAHQGYDLQLTRYDERGWRATFYTTGIEHSPTSATGTGWERTPWRATQRAAWVAVGQASGVSSRSFPCEHQPSQIERGLRRTAVGAWGVGAWGSVLDKAPERGQSRLRFF
jgi:hypothetical protein